MARGYGSLIWCRRGGSRNLKVAYSPRCFNQPNRRCRADGDYAMKTDVTKATAEEAEGTLFLGDDWFDPLEAGVRTAFAASSRSSWNRNSTLRWGETGMNGLGFREGGRRAPSRPTARPA